MFLIVVEIGAICNDCLTRLKMNRTPRLALANGMWIGDVPFELAVLTLPEQMLIARYFPSALIVKMYPRQKGARSLNSGLQGNVSTYRLDTNEIAGLVSDDVMPRPIKILASTIGVTFVGPKNLLEKSLPRFLHVRRRRVRDVHLWLKANNPLYRQILISEERLEEVPMDRIPNEILEVMRYSDDMAELERERTGYVPEDRDFTAAGDITSMNGFANQAAGE